MAGKPHQDTERNARATSGAGNAGGKPILPILFGFAAVIIFIIVSLAISRKPASPIRELANKSQNGLERTGTGSSTTAIGHVTGSTGDTGTHPTSVGVASSSSLPSGKAAGDGARAPMNYVAPHTDNTIDPNWGGK